ncbi:S24 family peptidase [Novosphingobium sp. KACC 22771]|uniref:S24 family peptidase n=1 Tax=Novosphingobium sp. KACC 22771 TaxID=3025670 RepID=UPI0023654E85|nr:LexA family transcriptional regulator [Novosphingobium sp. KACC 22771]WDF71251.1 S24 family peptidase [Novosphingobium sp. KACC 22771]
MEQENARTTLMALAAGRGVSLAALSSLIGRNSSYLQQFVKKKSPRKLEEGDRRKLAQFFGVDESVLGGAEEKSLATVGKPARSHWVDVPRLALDASAGPGAAAGGEQPFGALRFSQHWLRSMGLNPSDLTIIAVAGDSMHPVLNDGDEILVDRSRRALRDGIHVVRVGDHLMVKRIDMGHPGRVRLKSENPAYDPMDLAPEEVAVIGRVVWKGGRL